MEHARTVPETTLAPTPDLAHGRALAFRYCGSCHAVDRNDRSRHPQAPALRSLSERYPIDALGESLAEGLSSGHPDMPEFVFQPDGVRDLTAWLDAIQTKR